jgi:hypothetical protein
MAAMKRQIPTQLILGLIVLVVGGAVLGGEYFLVKWYPHHQQRVTEKTLRLLPYRNDALGIEMQVAAGLYGKVDPFPGGVKITRPEFWSIGPSLTITSQPNPDQSAEFSPQVLAKWQTDGVYQEVPRYRFEHTKINNRDAVLTWQLKDRYMLETARVMSPERIVEADCTPGQADEDLYLQACDASLRTLKVAGPEPPPTPAPGVLELASPRAGTAPLR